MRKFKFKLEPVLGERKRVEDMRLREWTLAKRFLQALLEDLGDLERALTDAIERGNELAGLGQGTNKPELALPASGMFAAVDTFIAGQKLRITWKGQEVERAAKFTERRRIDYVGARQKREALEKLKERQLEEFKEAAKKHEAKELDDLYIMNGAARRRMAVEDAS